jgi:hypothetical protein
MNLFIPSIGQSIRLTADWKFTLYNEYRNDSLFKMLGLGEINKWGTFCNDASKDITFPKDTVLTIDRIYIRKGNSEYNSVTFNLNRHPQKPKGRVRFWAKLDDVNKIEFDLRNRLVGDKIKFYLDNSTLSYGEGVITGYNNSKYYTVLLTSECKEFLKGTVITVEEKETAK